MFGSWEEEESWGLTSFLFFLPILLTRQLPPPFWKPRSFVLLGYTKQFIIIIEYRVEIETQHLHVLITTILLSACPCFCAKHCACLYQNGSLVPSRHFLLIYILIFRLYQLKPRRLITSDSSILFSFIFEKSISYDLSLTTCRLPLNTGKGFPTILGPLLLLRRLQASHLDSIPNRTILPYLYPSRLCLSGDFYQTSKHAPPSSLDRDLNQRPPSTSTHPTS